MRIALFLRIALFCHSLLSDPDHADAHFLRGIAAELDARGHDVLAFEPEDAWSALGLVTAAPWRGWTIARGGGSRR